MRYLILLLGLLSAAPTLTAQEVVPGRIMVKFHEPAGRAKAVDPVADQLRVFGMTEMIPVMTPGFRKAGGGALPDDLERTYQVRYVSGLDPAFVASKIANMPGVAYAEPVYMMRTARVPNDSLIGRPGHDFFGLHRLFEAWDVSTSNPDVVIAIVDSGTEYRHPDLDGNLWRNPSPGLAASMSELFSHIQNDTIGWNFWNSGDINTPEQNADPRPNGSTHGTHVGSIAAAETDNTTGLAGTGFDSRYMVVRVGGTMADPTAIGYGYPGILYATLNGADVINCSFGGPGYSQFGHDVVKFATANGSLVVAAAGNDNSEGSFYPGSYPEVLNVGSIRQDKLRSNFSNFGYSVDVMSRGQDVLGAIGTGSYVQNSGTSMASPLVAGIAALVRAAHPDWSPNRVRLQIRASANRTDLYAANTNPLYAYKLGNGYVDAYRAVAVPLPGWEIVTTSFLSASGRKLDVEETGVLRLEFVNRGVASGAMSVSFTALEAGITFPAGATAPLPATGNEGTAVVEIPIRIAGSYNFARIPLVRVEWEDSGLGYRDFDNVRYENFTYDRIDANRIRTSVGANGTVGFEDATNGANGIGFSTLRVSGTDTTASENMLYEGGLLITARTADGSIHVINTMRATSGFDRHFRPSRGFTTRRPGIVADLDGSTLFTNSGLPVAPDLEIRHEVFAFDSESLNRTVFLKYQVKNTDPNGADIEDLYLGLFLDWDIGDYTANNVGWVEADSLQYVYDPASLADYPYVALAHLGPISAALAIDNAYDGPVTESRFGTYYSAGSPTDDGFTPVEKRGAVSVGRAFTQVQQVDVAVLSATGPYRLNDGDSLTTGFVLAFGETLEILRAQVAAARAAGVVAVSPLTIPGEEPGPRPTVATLYAPYPNPFNPETTVRFFVPTNGTVRVEVYDVLGRRVGVLADRFYSAGEHEIPFDARGLASGVYRLRLSAGDLVRYRNVTLLR